MKTNPNFLQTVKQNMNGDLKDFPDIQKLEPYLKKFRQDPQDAFDYVRQLFGVAEGHNITKAEFTSQFPSALVHLVSLVNLSEEDDDDLGGATLSAEDLNRNQAASARAGPRKSRSASTQPKQMSAIGSHRNKNAKKKRRRKGQKYFPEEELMGKYEFVKYLGHGSYGHVCEARAPDGSRVALKKVDKIFGNIIDAKRFLREIRVLRTLKNHEAIVDLIDVLPPHKGDFGTFSSLYLVFEYVDTDLHHLIGTNQFFSALHCQYMLYQVLLSLKFMHTGELVHRDLKPATILINEDCSVKLCDFGLARGFAENADKPHPKTHLREINESDQANERKMKLNRDLTRHIVTRWYRAPEVILITQKREYLPAIDMWSVGCIMSELLQMQENNVPNAAEREPLFPGKSCFPLSAKDPFAYQDRMDQLNVIFEVIGTPSKEIIQECCNKQCQKYLF